MRSAFDLDPELIYLNAGTHSLCPREVQEAVTRYQRAYERNPTMGLIDVFGKVWQAQSRLCAFLNADPNDVFLRANITLAIGEFVQGIPLKKGSEILVTDLEYGAVTNACRLRAERDGLTLRAIHLPAEGTPAEIAKKLAAQFSPQTSLVVASHVTTATGFVIPIEELARETRSREILLAVDGAHAVGALDLDFSKLGDVDFYGGNLHKWLLGPKGTGFGWVNKRHHERLQPSHGGWPTFETPDYMQDYGGRFAQRMAPLGCHDFAPWLAINDTLEFWNHHGKERIRARVRELRALAEKELLEANAQWKVLSPQDRSRQGPLLTVDLKDELQPDGQKLIRSIHDEHKLQISITSVRGRWALRLSAHIHNSEEELKRAARILARYA